MKTTIEQIVEKKQETKKKLQAIKNKAIYVLYEGLCSNLDAKEVHQRLLDATLNKTAPKNELKIRAIILKNTLNLYKKAKNQANILGKAKISKQVKQTYGLTDTSSDPTTLLSVFMYKLIEDSALEQKLSKEINKELGEQEGIQKEEAISEEISQNRNLSNAKIFYLASSHDNSAKDHAPYQGKIYVDENYRSLTNDSRVSEYVRRHNTKTIQWVMHKPVWFVLRPNCKHYFISLKTEEVLGNSVDYLIQEHHTHRKYANKKYLQTLYHSTSKNWYRDINNAKLLLGKYKERLIMLQNLKKIRNNILIDRGIAKTKVLIKKWEDFINERENKAK